MRIPTFPQSTYIRPDRHHGCVCKLAINRPRVDTITRDFGKALHHLGARDTDASQAEVAIVDGVELHGGEGEKEQD